VKKITLNSYAKINLYLEVLNKSRDNYHNIKTVFQRISLCDKIILKARADREIRITCQHPAVPKNNSNLCYRSAKLLQDKFKINSGLDIEIIKRIPPAAGLGGGSSNAAAVLLGLNELWRLNLSKKRLICFARDIGSDVPFFVYNIPFAKGQGHGDKITPLAQLNNLRLWYILVVPPIKVSSGQIYQKWDKEIKAGAQDMAPKETYNRLSRRLTIAKSGAKIATPLLFNGLEQVTCKFYPQVRRIREKLKILGINSILMSGSGPAVFGIISSRKEAETLRRVLEIQHKSWQVYVTRTH